MVHGNEQSRDSVGITENEEETHAPMTQSLEQEVQSVLKSMMITDLRQALRARGLSPAGGKETLMERLKEVRAKWVSTSLPVHCLTRFAPTYRI